jgi:hypothetical protein
VAFLPSGHARVKQNLLVKPLRYTLLSSRFCGREFLGKRISIGIMC